MKQCLRCNHSSFWKLSTGQLRCKKCKLTRIYSLRASQIPRIPSYWKGRLLEFFILGVPAYRLHYQVPLSLKTLESFFRFLREFIYQQTLKELKVLQGQIEMDETMFGGRRPGKRGWGAEGKHLVFGLYKRNGAVLTFPVSSRGKQTLIPLIESPTKPGSLYYTDGWHAYTSLSLKSNHVVIRKEKGRPKGRDHINGIEGFWSYAKHWLYPYRGIHKNYFPFYLKECEWRFNHRKENLIPILRQLLNQQIVKEPI